MSGHAGTDAAMKKAREALLAQQQQQQLQQSRIAAISSNNQPPASYTASWSLQPSDRAEMQQLVDLISKCKGSGDKDPDYVRLLPHVKNVFKRGDAYVSLGFETLFSKLKDKSAVVRMNLLHLIDCLFMRSAKFRTLLLENFHEFLELSVGVGSKAALYTPKPPAQAKELQLLSIGFVRDWHDAFGESLKFLRVGHQFMQDKIGGIVVPSRLERAQAAEREATERKRKTQQILRARYDRLVSEIEPNLQELQSVITQINNTLEILFPQANQESFSDFVLQAIKRAESTGKSTVEEPASKRVKREASTGKADSIVPGLPTDSTHDEEGEEWETEEKAAESVPTPSEVTTLTAMEESSSSSIPVTGTEAAIAEIFQSNQSTVVDTHWWMDEPEYEDDEMDDGSDILEEGAAADDQDGSMSGQKRKRENSEPAHLAHGLGRRDYVLNIEFDANVTENDENRVLFEVIRENWNHIQKTFMPLLQEWIDTLTRIELRDSESSSAAVNPNNDRSRAAVAASSSSSSSAGRAAVAAANGNSNDVSSAQMRAQRDEYLVRCVAARESIDSVMDKCRKLGMKIDSNEADRNDLVRKAMEKGFSDQNDIAKIPNQTANGVPRKGSQLAATQSAAATSQAVQLLSSHVNAQKRAMKKIRAAKRKLAKRREAERLERRVNPAAAAAAAIEAASRRPFSGTAEEATKIIANFHAQADAKLAASGITRNETKVKVEQETM